MVLISGQQYDFVIPDIRLTKYDAFTSTFSGTAPAGMRIRVQPTLFGIFCPAISSAPANAAGQWSVTYPKPLPSGFEPAWHGIVGFGMQDDDGNTFETETTVNGIFLPFVRR